MGKRAVPFIYEKIKEEPSFIVCALSEIYRYSLAKQLGYKSYLGPSKLCELWIEKLSHQPPRINASRLGSSVEKPENFKPGD